MPKAIVRGFVGPFEHNGAYLISSNPHPETGEIRYKFKVKNHTFVIDSPNPDPWGKDWLVQINSIFRKNKRPDGTVDKRNTGIRLKLFPIPDKHQEKEGVLEWFTEFAVVLHVCKGKHEDPIEWLGASIDQNSRSMSWLVGILRLL